MSSVILEDLERIVSEPLDWERFRGKRVLISGASGSLPGYMVRTLMHLNEVHEIECEVIGLVRDRPRAVEQFSEFSDHPRFTLISCDVSKGIEVDVPCDFVIHAASQASPIFFGSDPVGTMTANLFGTYHLLMCAVKWKSEAFLLFSSGEVYGKSEPEQIPTREEEYGFLDILDPRCCYAESKRAAETLTASFIAQYGIHASIVRPYHTYGPGMKLNDGRVHADFVTAVMNKEDLCLFSDGSAIRPFCYLADAVSGFFTVLLSGKSGSAYNVGNPEALMSIRELAELFLDLFPDLNLKINYQKREDSTYMSSPVSLFCPEITRIRSLGWEPRTTPASGFKRTVEYFTG